MSTVEQRIADHLPDAGIPGHLAGAIAQAFAAAGLRITDEATSATVLPIGTLQGERFAAEGLPGVFVCAVSIGGGRLAWIERVREGRTHCSEPVYVPGE